MLGNFNNTTFLLYVNFYFHNFNLLFKRKLYFTLKNLGTYYFKIIKFKVTSL
jgi:hypothetical protein